MSEICWNGYTRILLPGNNEQRRRANRRAKNRDREELEKTSEELEGSKIAIEATSNWMYIYEIMEKNSDVKLVNPGKTKAIASAKVKNDRLDAKMLAHLLRANLIAESHIPSKLIRDLRSLVRYRKALIEDRQE
ncbi:MAG: transposase [Methanocellales archaeon]|nr:transposase [Methanocellales archaeon]